MFDNIFKYFQGRHTFFAAGFFFAGNFMHWHGKLDNTYIFFMTTLLGFVLGHSIKEDVVEKVGINTGVTSNGPTN